MGKRTRIGLIYNYDQGWIAGVYYILNLVHALNQLEDKDKPELIILSTSYEKFLTIKATGYPYLQFNEIKVKDMWGGYSLAERVINKISRVFSGKNSIIREHTNKRLSVKLDILFPATNHIYFSNVENKLFWIPDFQEHFLPQFFSAQEIDSRKSFQKQLSDDSCSVVFSSNNALAHFKTIYPQSKSKVFVLQFAVTHESYKNISVPALLEKFRIAKPYFFCPNQVWAHKNHITVLKSLKFLKDQGEKDILIVFSGKEHDHRNPGFFEKLKTFVRENDIEDNVRFLGFIDREEQLQLMDNAICVIQPSLFEGWSTVVEDAKSMSQYVIASDLLVHKEQLLDNSVFFEPTNEAHLAKYLSEYNRRPPFKKEIYYEENIRGFGEMFIKIVNEVVPAIY